MESASIAIIGPPTGSSPQALRTRLRAAVGTTKKSVVPVLDASPRCFVRRTVGSVDASSSVSGSRKARPGDPGSRTRRPRAIVFPPAPVEAAYSSAAQVATRRRQRLLFSEDEPVVPRRGRTPDQTQFAERTVLTVVSAARPFASAGA